MITVSDVANRFGVSASAVRLWCETFADYLSAQAVPPSGVTRTFTGDDLAVFGLVVKYREEEKAGYEEIKRILDSGERHPPPDEMPQQETGTGLTVAQMTATIGQQQGIIETLRDERDYLRGKLTDEQVARLEAEKRAAAAEMEARLRKELQQPAQRKSLLDRLLGR